jgi:hypothetical protein
MFQQSILQALQDVGFDPMDWSQLAGPSMTSANIADVFAQHYGLTDDEGLSDLVPGMFQSITPEMLQGASYKTYAPQIQAKGQSMLSDLYKGLGGQTASKAAGGFAGSGGFGKQQAGIKDVYGKSMTDTLTSVRGQQSQGIGAISDLISQWNQMAQRIKGI